MVGPANSSGHRHPLALSFRSNCTHSRARYRRGSRPRLIGGEPRGSRIRSDRAGIFEPIRADLHNRSRDRPVSDYRRDVSGSGPARMGFGHACIRSEHAARRLGCCPRPTCTPYIDGRRNDRNSSTHLPRLGRRSRCGVLSERPWLCPLSGPQKKSNAHFVFRLNESK